MQSKHIKATLKLAARKKSLDHPFAGLSQKMKQATLSILIPLFFVQHVNASLIFSYEGDCIEFAYGSELDMCNDDANGPQTVRGILTLSDDYAAATGPIVLSKSDHNWNLQLTFGIWEFNKSNIFSESSEFTLDENGLSGDFTNLSAGGVAYTFPSGQTYGAFFSAITPGSIFERTQNEYGFFLDTSGYLFSDNARWNRITVSEPPSQALMFVGALWFLFRRSSIHR